MARTEKLAGAIISLLLNIAHLRVHRMVHVLGSKLIYEPELAKLPRYSAVFSPQGKLNLSEDVSKFLSFQQRGTTMTISLRATRKLHGSSPPHQDTTNALQISHPPTLHALHLHIRPSPALGSQTQSHGHHLFSIQSLAAAAYKQKGEISCRVWSWEARPTLWRTFSCRYVSVMSFADFRKCFLIQIYLS